MKKISYLMAFLMLTNCGTTKKVNSQGKTIEDLENALDYVVRLPNNWETIFNHNFISYTPKNLGDIYYKNQVIIKKTVTDTLSLNRMVQREIDTLNSKVRTYAQTIRIEQSKYGETYVHRYNHRWNFTKYLVETRYFKYKGEVYKFNYSSDEDYFNRFFKQSMNIFDTLQFK